MKSRKPEQSKQFKKQAGQRGIASIVITMITMVVISLIVIGFATISRREQRQTLDQQLSVQAFYAAESGIEDAKNVIKTAIANGQTIKSKDSCTNNNGGPGADYPTGAQTVIDAANGVSYTCLLVEPSPGALQYNSVSDSSVVVPVTIGGQPITGIRVTWSPNSAVVGSPATECPANTNANAFKPQTATGWTCKYGVLRADLVPTVGALDRTSLTNKTLTAFFQPAGTSQPGTLGYGGNTNKPNLISGKCGTVTYTQCEAVFDTSSISPQSLTLRLSSIYQPSNIKVEALNAGVAQGISGTQVTIDSTGKANDVLRRIKVNLPVIASGGLMPSFAVQSNGSICKRFATTANYFNIPSDITQPDPANPMCQPTTDGTP